MEPFDKTIIIDEEIAYIDDVEYIRKDVLLEWANEELTKASRSSGTIGRRNAFVDMIDKINSI